ncbi:MAG TPA: type IV pilus assembly protein PilM [Thermodesulfobacteriota bacterium]|nr:type IV pilus assembly protein PilM [Thermodesulfobacteriota bacterium]
MAISIWPFFAKRDAAAFDIGSSSVKVVHMSQTKKGWELEKLAMAEFPPEAIVDGSIIDSMTVIKTIKDLVKEQGIKVKDAVSSLTGHSVIIKKVSFPAVSEEELSESIQWEAEQYIPFPITEVNIDFQILGADSEGRGQMDVMLAAVKKDVINDYTNVIREAGLNPVIIDVDAFALENMLEINYPAVAGETIAVVNIGASITSISVLVGGVTTFTRSVPMGGNQFTEEIQRQMNVSFKEAEALKTGRAKGDAKGLAGVVDGVSANLCMDVKRSLDFFLGGGQTLNVNKIYLSGGGSKTRGLKDMMQEKISIPVEPINPFKNLEHSDKAFDEEMLADLAPYFAVGVGLATRKFGDR